MMIKVFTAKTCGPCKMLYKQLESLDIEVEYIDIDDNFFETVSYGVRSTPTMLFMNGEEVLSTIVGFRHSSQIKEEMEKLENEKKKK